MAYEVSVYEGGEERKQLVPLATLLAIPAQFDGKSLNDLIAGDDVAPESWEPWVAWHAKKHRRDEKRAFDVWCQEIDWWELRDAPAIPVPSGGQESLTGAPSQSSSPAAPAPGPSSSSSTTTSSTPSGLSSTAA